MMGRTITLSKRVSRRWQKTKSSSKITVYVCYFRRQCSIQSKDSIKREILERERRISANEGKKL